MFKASMQDFAKLKDSLEAISSLITEGNFRITKDGIRLVAMDPASVAMVILDVLPSAFLTYECDGDHSINLNITNFVTILKRAKANDMITLDLSDDKMRITMKGNVKRTFSLPIIVSADEEQKVPELDFKGKIEMDAEVMKDGIKDASMVSDLSLIHI